jgi:hypothetical protein
MDLTTILQNERTLLIVSSEDLTEFAIKLLGGQKQENPPAKSEVEKPMSQVGAIEFLGKSRQTLNSWRKKKIINAYRLGGRVYYKPSELVAALEKTK